VHRNAQSFPTRRSSDLGNQVKGVVAYKSRDLKTWIGPVTVFATPEDNWAPGPIWAPEVHHYNGKYYLFATLNTHVEWKKKEDGRSEEHTSELQSRENLV